MTLSKDSDGEVVKYDTIVVGGSFAGLAAALYLARARRKVAVFDTGEPRNRFSAHSHGVFAIDGKPGPELLEAARSQLTKYPTARLFRKKVISATRMDDSLFEVETEENDFSQSRRLVLATGVVDQFPKIPGFQELWGKKVFHCPYCDGYGISGGNLGVIATLPISLHYSSIISDWGEVTLFTNRSISLDAQAKDVARRRKIKIVEQKVARLEENSSDGAVTIVLDDDSKVCVKAVFALTPVKIASYHLAQGLDCAFTSAPRGEKIKTDEWRMTSVSGVYAIGDISRPHHSISLATADGVTAALGIHQSLISEEERGMRTERVSKS